MTYSIHFEPRSHAHRVLIAQQWESQSIAANLIKAVMGWAEIHLSRSFAHDTDGNEAVCCFATAAERDGAMVPCYGAPRIVESCPE